MLPLLRLQKRWLLNLLLILQVIHGILNWWWLLMRLWIYVLVCGLWIEFHHVVIYRSMKAIWIALQDWRLLLYALIWLRVDLHLQFLHGAGRRQVHLLELLSCCQLLLQLQRTYSIRLQLINFHFKFILLVFQVSNLHIKLIDLPLELYQRLLSTLKLKLDCKEHMLLVRNLAELEETLIQELHLYYCLFLLVLNSAHLLATHK